MDDREAIQRLKRGEIGGLDFLVTRYQLKAARTAFLITRDTQMASDVVQETFLRISQKVGGYDEQKPFEPYLLSSVVHAALNAIQKTSRWVEIGTLEDVRQVEMFLERTAKIEEQVDISLLKQEILSALNKLTPRQRAVIVQRYYLEMSEKEMAEALHAAPGTIKWLLNAARSRLRTLLRRERSVE